MRAIVVMRAGFPVTEPGSQDPPQLRFREGGRHRQIKAVRRLFDLLDKLTRTALRRTSKIEVNDVAPSGFSCFASWIETHRSRTADPSVLLSWYAAAYSDTIFGIQRSGVTAEPDMLEMQKAMVSAARRDAVQEARAYSFSGSQGGDAKALAVYRNALLGKNPGDCCRTKSVLERDVEQRARRLWVSHRKTRSGEKR